MPALTLPLTFANSFWSQDIRQGLETLYGKLEQVTIFLYLELSLFLTILRQGVEENDEIISFIQVSSYTDGMLPVTEY